VIADPRIGVGDVAGVRIGHATDRDGGTGCTVVIPPVGTVGGVDVRGGGPSTRELALLEPLAGPAGPTAVLLTGGSAHGLAAADGVAAWCEERGLGHEVPGVARVPIVTAAVIFDLGVAEAGRRPGPADGRAACDAATEGPHARGSVGAGTGATVGKLLRHEGWCKGGIGGAGLVTADGCTVAALAVANCYGDVIDADGSIIAGCWIPGEGLTGTTARMMREPPPDSRLEVAGNTTLCVVVTDAALDPPGASAVARMASSGLARGVSPVGTRVDGDVVVALATGARPGNVMICGVAAAEAAAEAVRDAVRNAESLRGVPTAADRAAGGA
jgi:L-aminopeptidase/D-esterase-like protein